MQPSLALTSNLVRLTALSCLFVCLLLFFNQKLFQLMFSIEVDSHSRYLDLCRVYLVSVIVVHRRGFGRETGKDCVNPILDETLVKIV